MATPRHPTTMRQSHEAKVRVATAADHAAILDLLVTQLREHHVATSARRLGVALATAIEHRERGRILVATLRERSGGARRVAGFAALSFMWPLEHGGRAAWLEELYVRPDLREHGIGTSLLREAIRVAARHGAHAIDLEVDRDHARAARLYQRHGFAPLPRERWVLMLAKRATRGRSKARAAPPKRRRSGTAT